MDGQPPFGRGSMPRSSLPPKPGMPGSPVQQSAPWQPHDFQGMRSPRSDGVRPGYGRHPGMGPPQGTPPTGGPMAPPAGGSAMQPNWPYQRPESWNWNAPPNWQPPSSLGGLFGLWQGHGT